MERNALQDHPNPTRRGCPDGETLEAFAQNPKAFAMRDPIFEHLAQCSPCFQFVQERRQALACAVRGAAGADPRPTAGEFQSRAHSAGSQGKITFRVSTAVR